MEDSSFGADISTPRKLCGRFLWRFAGWVETTAGWGGTTGAGRVGVRAGGGPLVTVGPDRFAL